MKTATLLEVTRSGKGWNAHLAECGLDVRVSGHAYDRLQERTDMPLDEFLASLTRATVEAENARQRIAVLSFCTKVPDEYILVVVKYPQSRADVLGIITVYPKWDGRTDGLHFRLIHNYNVGPTRRRPFTDFLDRRCR